MAGEFQPGARISEPALASKLGVSRAPIREALVELQLRGLVEFDSTGHTRIPVLTPEDLREIYTVRLMIDSTAASLAATHASPEAFASLEANIAATKSAKTLGDVSRLDAEFHGGIVQASGNRRLLLCWNVLRDQIGLWLAQMQVRRENIARRTRQQTVVAHRQLLEVIRRGNAEEAATAARGHVAGWIELLPDCSRSPVLAGQADDGQGRPPSGVMARGAGRRKKA